MFPSYFWLALSDQVIGWFSPSFYTVKKIDIWSAYSESAEYRTKKEKKSFVEVAKFQAYIRSWSKSSEKPLSMKNL